MSKEAMKLALEALENSRSLEPVDVQWVKGKRHAAITALREALAEQPAQQEPVQNNPLDCNVYLGSGKDHVIKNHVSYGPAQRTWEEWFKWWRTSKVADSTEAEIDFADFMLIVRAVEYEYGIKEQNT